MISIVLFTACLIPTAFSLPAAVEADILQRASRLNQTSPIDLRTPGIFQGAPDCHKIDPSGIISKTLDGSGKYVGSDCTDRYGAGGDATLSHDNCWTDYYILGYTPSTTGWQQLDDTQLGCGDESTGCSSSYMSGNSVCLSHTWGVGGTVGIGIQGFTPNIQIQNSYTYQSCTTQSTTRTCNSKPDGDVKVLWGYWNTRLVKGYMRRSCNNPYPASAREEQCAHRNDGYCTRGIFDFEIPTQDAKMSYVECGLVDHPPDKNIPSEAQAFVPA